jgi:hypothetical protein
MFANIFVAKPEDKKPNGTTWHRREDNIVKDLKERDVCTRGTRCWACLAQIMDQDLLDRAIN